MLPFPDAGLRVLALDTAAALPCRRRWLQDEILSLVSCYPSGEPVADMARRFGRSPTAVYGKARRMGLHRPQRAAPASVAVEIPPEQIELAWPAPASVLDLVPPTPDDPPFLPPVELPAPVARQVKPFRLTVLGGRLTVWTPELVDRLILLWVGGYHHTVIAEVLDLTPCGVSSKAHRISLPFRAGVDLSKDVAAARRADAAGGEVPMFIFTASGRRLTRKRCNLTGTCFYGDAGTRTCAEAKMTLFYDRMQATAF